MNKFEIFLSGFAEFNIYDLCFNLLLLLFAVCPGVTANNSANMMFIDIHIDFPNRQVNYGNDGLLCMIKKN
ncbi:hypothetical protein [Methanobrevibacter sp.]|uniref:hypothetical protein n=1 Tax=Methanobrevibacter sp. TaxID=66852 RepID=UPI0025E0B672|nr:hypothetical protein [Methanobrevibacter sp.]MEE0941722.1 hypothetical protein [Methanobrevibacter sp.]